MLKVSITKGQIDQAIEHLMPGQAIVLYNPGTHAEWADFVQDVDIRVAMNSVSPVQLFIDEDNQRITLVIVAQILVFEERPTEPNLEVMS